MAISRENIHELLGSLRQIIVERKTQVQYIINRLPLAEKLLAYMGELQTALKKSKGQIINESKYVSETEGIYGQLQDMDSIDPSDPTVERSLIIYVQAQSIITENAKLGLSEERESPSAKMDAVIETIRRLVQGNHGSKPGAVANSAGSGSHKHEDHKLPPIESAGEDKKSASVPHRESDHKLAVLPKSSQDHPAPSSKGGLSHDNFGAAAVLAHDQLKAVAPKQLLEQKAEPAKKPEDRKVLQVQPQVRHEVAPALPEKPAKAAQPHKILDEYVPVPYEFPIPYELHQPRQPEQKAVAVVERHIPNSDPDPDPNPDPDAELDEVVKRTARGTTSS
jgi:hypothetical protein